MVEIVAAVIGGVFVICAAVITARWSRSRSASPPVPEQASTGGSAQSDQATIDARHAGQFIATNNGTVSQTNYRDGKR